MEITITGGAGYIGSTLSREALSRGHDVTVLDNLLQGGRGIVDLMDHQQFRFIKGDTTVKAAVDSAVSNADAVVHLAAIVGDPACSKQPDRAHEVNMTGSKNVLESASDQGLERFVFASTCSNYGRDDDVEYMDESSTLNPLSLYARTKVNLEKKLLEFDSSMTTTVLRFATVFGWSPRMRFDLTVNHFTRDLIAGKKLEIYRPDTWRPYCHVRDISRAILKVLESDKDTVNDEVFNVGDSDENYQKRMIVEEIREITDSGEVEYVNKEDDDPRDYKVSFEKIADELDFEITRSVPDGIQLIAEILENEIVANPFEDRYHNV